MPAAVRSVCLSLTYRTLKRDSVFVAFHFLRVKVELGSILKILMLVFCFFYINSEYVCDELCDGKNKRRLQLT